jgi:hypothetical protein
MTEGHISGANGIYHCDPQGEYFLKIYSLLKYRGNTTGVFLVRLSQINDILILKLRLRLRQMKFLSIKLRLRQEKQNYKSKTKTRRK